MLNCLLNSFRSGLGNRRETQQISAQQREETSATDYARVCGYNIEHRREHEASAAFFQ